MQVTDLDYHTFSLNQELEVLDLSNNNLTFQPMPHWNSNKQLKEVDFSNNHINITELPLEWTSTIWLKLEKLNLSRNFIGETLRIEDFNWRQSTGIKVDLSRNRIKRIEFQVYMHDEWNFLAFEFGNTTH